MLLVLAAAAASIGPPAPVASRGATIAIHWDGQLKSCVPTVRGVETGDVGTERGREALGAAITDRGAPLHLLGGASVPYACLTGVIDALKRAGHYGPVGFVAEPPPRR